MHPLRWPALGLLALPMFAACGSRTGLLTPSPALEGADAGADASVTTASCPAWPAIPAPVSVPLGAACTFSAASSATAPVLAAIVDRDLLGLTPQATFQTLFRFESRASTVIDRELVSRGDFLGALVAALPSSTTLEIELVLLRRDGTVLVHHRETFSTQTFGGAFGVAGNAGGAFAFGGGLGGTGRVWMALADGQLLGPWTGVTLPGPELRVDPDARGRLLVLPADTNSSVAVSWLDPCSGAQSLARLPAGGQAAASGERLLGITRGGQLSAETADGVSALPLAPVGPQASMWDFWPAGVAMFAVPPFPSGTSATANLDVVDFGTLVSHPVSLAYPGLSLLPSDAWLSEVGDSNDPAGFGLDSAGHVTMFLQDTSGAVHLETTAHGSDWTPVGEPVTYDPGFEPSTTLAFTEAAGTYVVQGIVAGGGKEWQVVRPATGVDVVVQGPGRLARDGGCAAALVGGAEVDVVSAVTGQLTRVTLPNPATSDWTSTWIPGDDAPPLP